MEIATADRVEEVRALAPLLRRYLDLVAAELADVGGFDPDEALGWTLEGAGEVVPPEGRTFVAREAGAVLGVAMLRRRPEARMELKRFFVVEEARGRGIGRALLAAAIAEARARGARELVLDTADSLTAARRLYGAMGFVEGPAYAGADSLGLPEMLERILFYRLAL